MMPVNKLASDTKTCQGCLPGQTGRNQVQMQMHIRWSSQCTMMRPSADIDKIYGRGDNQVCPAGSRWAAGRAPRAREWSRR